MKVDMFLKLGDIKGESVDAKHAGEIDVSSWGWSMDQSGTTHRGTGGGSGKVSVKDILIHKHVDKASPNLIISCCTGKHFDQAVLTIRKAGENPLEYFKIVMKEVLITQVMVGDNGVDEKISEDIKLNFAEFRVEYVPQKSDGSGDATFEAGFNIAKNVRI